MTGHYLRRVRIAWGSKRALAALLGCSRHMILSNERRRYVTIRMRVLMDGRGMHARRLAKGYWRAHRQNKLRAAAQKRAGK